MAPSPLPPSAVPPPCRELPPPRDGIDNNLFFNAIDNAVFQVTCRTGLAIPVPVPNSYLLAGLVPLLLLLLCICSCCWCWCCGCGSGRGGRRRRKKDKRGDYRAVANTYRDATFDNAFADRFSDDDDSSYDDPEDRSWKRSKGRRVLEMKKLGKRKGDDNLSLEEMNG
eukprot:jgi/Psemu1/313238/fgenesh1_kg.1129_\